jgi:hypothetical protein
MERNWRADRAAEARMYALEAEPATTPVEPSDERAELPS